MSFDPLNSDEIAAGKPTKQELFTKTKGNFDDHEDRLIVVEGAIGRLPPIEFDVVGVLNSPLTMTAALVYRIAANLKITAARLLIKTAGASGSVQIDIEYKRGAGAWTSILSSPVSASYALGDYATVSGTLALQDFQSGDLLRMNINSVQVNMQDFSVYLENEAA
jgi:hypothetical protein